MRNYWILTACSLLLMGCSTIGSRISDQQQLFDGYPPSVQKTIRDGQVAVGFTPEQVRMALGKPDHVYQKIDDAGASVVWGYSGSSLGLSLGLGGFSSGGLAGGVGVSSNGSSNKDKIRVVFQNNRVTSVERRVQ